MKIIKRNFPSHTQQPIDFIDEGTVDKERVTLSGAGASFQILTGSYDGLEITDANGKVIIIRTDTVTSTQIEPAAAVPFAGTTQDLKDLLKDTFFFDVASGGGGAGRTTVINPVSPYTVSNGDIVLWDTTAGNKIIDLPTAAAGVDFVIDVKKTDITANTITINPNGAETIEDAAEAVITDQYEAITTISDGSEWYII